ncbi:MAG: hypothetical protein DRQ49_04250 [Gammaproteobacteria bacterium]|nr:MAG: hypothetical protein DRQ49_04250 [Gammaproteobacteria bacterium]RKZ43083.1 MAG: hypothetical protein DRQ41_06175 [Gammaproteobacteria bacterium]
MIVKSVALRGAAVHTRKKEPGQDYDWYVKAGHLQLFDKMDEIYRIALRDISAEVPKLAVILDEKSIGFLIGDMPCQRMDHSKRIIHDTLYLEFDLQYHPSVLHTAGVLLLCSKNAYQIHEKHFMAYAERLLAHSPSTQLSLKRVKLPVVSKQPNFNLASIRAEKLALFSDSVNRNRCARYLIHFKYRDNHRFSFVSTGRLKLEKCQQIADKSDECVLLTISSEVQSEINLKKNRFPHFRKMFA